jgi:hypothetical protein
LPALDLFHVVRDRMPDATALTASRILAMLAVVVMTAIMIEDFVQPTTASVVTEPARPDWIEAARTNGAFALSYASIDSLEQRYTVRRHRDGGGRKDLMTWGSAGSDAPYVRIAIYRPGGEGAPPLDPLDAIAALAAESQINAELVGSAGEIGTKFGPLALVDMTVSRMGEEPRTCLAAVGAWDDPRLGIALWWCNPGPAMVAHGRLACLVDRLVLMSAGGDDRLAAFFARAELNRDFCGSAGPLLSAMRKRADDWVFIKAEPKLRGTLRGR